MSLVTLQEIKDFLGITGSAQDAKLTIFQESVEASVKNYCDCAFEPVAVTGELHDGTTSDVIVPKFSPLISIQGLYFWTDVDGTGGTQMDEDRDFYFDENAITLREQYSPRGRGIVRIDYTHGYATVPGDVKLAILQSVKAELRRDSNNTEHIASRSKMNESEGFNAAWDKKTGLPSQIISKLQPYRVYEVPLVSMAQRNR